MADIRVNGPSSINYEDGEKTYEGEIYDDKWEEWVPLWEKGDYVRSWNLNYSSGANGREMEEYASWGDNGDEFYLGNHNYASNNVVVRVRMQTQRNGTAQKSVTLNKWRATGLRATTPASMLSTETINVYCTTSEEPPDGMEYPTFYITKVSGPAITINGGDGAWTITCNEWTLAVDTPLVLRFNSSVSAAGNITRTITVKPSLTGVNISVSSNILNYANSWRATITATPLPIGTGAPVSYTYAVTNAAYASYITLSPNGNICTVQGNTNLYTSIPVRVTAYLTGNTSLSFYQDTWFQVRPNMRAFDGSFRNGQPYVFDGSFREAVEVYVFDGSWRPAKVN